MGLTARGTDGVEICIINDHRVRHTKVLSGATAILFEDAVSH